jgi:hypothetical protein
MIGNIWTNTRFEEIRAFFKNENVIVDWYGFGGSAPWIKTKPSEWIQDNIFYQGWLDTTTLFNCLKSYPFFILPTGEMDHTDESLAISALSLPSRLLFIILNIALPVLVLGSAQTELAAFVKKHGLGLQVSTKSKAFADTALRFYDRNYRLKLQKNLKSFANKTRHFKTSSIIWDILDGGEVPEKICEL